MQNVPRFRPLLVLLPCVALVAGSLASWPYVANWHGDVQIYAGYADQIMRGSVPYRDFRPEYPPLALLPFLVPYVLGFGRELSEDQYRLLFLLQNTVYCGAMSCVVLWIGHQLRHAQWPLAVWMTALIGILSPFLPWRFDIFPALLTSLAMLAIYHARPLFGGVWLGLGVAAKLYPLVLGPVLAVRYVVAREWRALVMLVVGGIVALAFTVLPFYLIDREGLLSFLAYHQQRGIQLESVAGGIICLGQLFGMTTAAVEFNYGAMHLNSPWAAAMLPWLTPLLLLGYGLVAAIAAYAEFAKRRRRGQHHTIDGMFPTFELWCAALLVFIVTNKVFSPQYLVWLLPFVPFLRIRQLAVFTAISAATVIIFPFGYGAMMSLEPWTVWLLNLRNMATLALLAWVIVDCWRAVVPAARSVREPEIEALASDA